MELQIPIKPRPIRLPSNPCLTAGIDELNAAVRKVELIELGKRQRYISVNHFTYVNVAASLIMAAEAMLTPGKLCFQTEPGVSL